MKRSNLWKIIWVIGIYAILAIILYLVILYKVQWEHKDLNTYMYIYDCNQNICTSTTKQENYYSKVICEDNICPYITEIIEENVILNKNNKSWIYNYIDNKVVNNQYLNYKYINNNIFIVTNEHNKQGVINLSGDVLVTPEYNYIEDYNNGFIVYKENNLYGINTSDDINNVEPHFENIVLINDKMFAGMKDNIYKIYNYSNIDSVDSNKYDYVYSYSDIILVVNNNKIDIITTDLNSTLLMKIDTFYEYTIEKERDSLDLYADGENIYFKVFNNENEYTTYKYNIANKKLV